MDHVIIEEESGHGVLKRKVLCELDRWNMRYLSDSIHLAGLFDDDVCRVDIIKAFLLTGGFDERGAIDGMIGDTIGIDGKLRCDKYRPIFDARVHALRQILEVKPECMDVFAICLRAGEMAEDMVKVEAL